MNPVAKLAGAPVTGLMDPLSPLVPADVAALEPFVLAVAATLLAPSAWTMYRRLARHRLLASPMRRAVLDAFRARPGATVSDVTARLGVDYKTVQHHARVLAEFGHLRACRDGRRIRYHAQPTAASAPGRPRSN